jgi:hypothetical protein
MSRRHRQKSWKVNYRLNWRAITSIDDWLIVFDSFTPHPFPPWLVQPTGVDLYMGKDKNKVGTVHLSFSMLPPSQSTGGTWLRECLQLIRPKIRISSPPLQPRPFIVFSWQIFRPGLTI